VYGTAGVEMNLVKYATNAALFEGKRFLVSP